MTTHVERIVALVQAIGPDVKQLKNSVGNIDTLSTTAKTNLVAAINELKAAVSGTVTIDDTVGTGATTVTWSADKIYNTIELAKQAVKDQILDGASSALDTLKEFQDAINNDPTFATTILDALGKRVRVDAEQIFTDPEKAQGRANIGAASAADLSALVADLGDLTTDLVAIYNAAKA